MLILFLQFLIRLFFHRPHGVVPGQRASNTAALFWAIEDSARRQFGKRYVSHATQRSWPAPLPCTSTGRTEDDLFFGL